MGEETAAVPVSVLVLPLLVVAVVTARGGGGGGLLGLEVLQGPVAVLRVLLAGLVLLVLEVRRGVALRAAARFSWGGGRRGRRRWERKGVGPGGDARRYSERGEQKGVRSKSGWEADTDI